MIPIFRAWDSMHNVMLSPEELRAKEKFLTTHGDGFISNQHLHPMLRSDAKDINGVYIYEDDIVKVILHCGPTGAYITAYHWQVIWDCGRLRFDDHFTLHGAQVDHLSVQPHKLEVVGNVHEDRLEDYYVFGGVRVHPSGDEPQKNT